MKLAVNFSDAVISLITRNTNFSLDYVKVPTIPFPECWKQFHQGKLHCKILPHLAQTGILFLSHPELRKSVNEHIIQLVLEHSEAPYLSTHIEAPVNHFPNYEKELHNRNLVINKALKKRFLKAIQLVKEIIDVPLVLENCPYYVWYHYFKESCDPQFISELCEDGDCGLVLDIAHARISAENFNIDVNKYIDALPLSKVKEIHLSGIRQDPPIGFWDSHTKLDEDDYILLRYVLNKTNPEVVTIEYGGYPNYEPNPIHGGYVDCPRNNPRELEEMLTRVLAMVKNREN